MRGDGRQSPFLHGAMPLPFRVACRRSNQDAASDLESRLERHRKASYFWMRARHSATSLCFPRHATVSRQESPARENVTGGGNTVPPPSYLPSRMMSQTILAQTSALPFPGILQPSIDSRAMRFLGVMNKSRHCDWTTGALFWLGSFARVSIYRPDLCHWPYYMRLIKELEPLVNLQGKTKPPSLPRIPARSSFANQNPNS